ncbi:ComEC/Rec2 family competence protein [Ruminococcus flavefaciens]|uniref:Metal-dependent hydrolase, beta-lactamase superfamily II n=1 Tax=Ruminococcus flavefaciens TaxID=1265 RepID=A0A1M7LGP7_RUMFL|nr:MBL fold metallo-hydrolase [Ruminococcus flavefaciens]SHM77272.1 Metal-dependent hydrolase, beta-lactamase superfamily II [Ruminococcus flavefaciens]
MFRIKKLAAAAAATVIAALSLFSCSNNEPPADAKEMKVTFLEAGKADAIVIQSETGTVVIDCGEKGDGKKIANLLNESGRTTIDYLIITHFDQDHVGGAPKVLNNFEIKNLITPNYEGNNDEYKKYVKTINELNIQPQKLTSDLTFTLDDVQYTVYVSKKDYYGDDDENDFSLVTKAVHHKNTLLFTGDAMEQRLDEIMDIGKCTLLKVPYHGRKLDNLGDFLKKVKPKYAVTCSSSTEFSGKMQDLIAGMNIKSYATCFNGDITATSDGAKITFETER